jgi:coenzyme F420-0:L-glutamate ligase/coenzyme F420-1:gamma-L-glutamate ligase
MMTVFAVEGIPEVVAGDDLARLIGEAVSMRRDATAQPASEAGGLEHGDILVVTSKIVSKAEGRSVKAEDREEAITSQTVRVVASRQHAHGVTRIVENPLGLVQAAAGVDSSNAPDGTVLLLPEDPDASARLLKAHLESRFGIQLGVIISDTFGRPWRQGQTDVAIGAAGVRVLDDLRGTRDAGGKLLDVTVAAVADEIAGAANLVAGKSRNIPVVVVRGLSGYVGGPEQPGARTIVRPVSEDMFRLGTAEAWNEGYTAGLAARSTE